MSKRKARRAAAAAASKPMPAVGTSAGGLAIHARYDAAGHGRRLAEWRAPATGPNKATAGLATIRNRSRDAGRNEWTGASSARVMVTNLVGTGITARPKTKDKTIKARLTDEWDKFVRSCDADGVLDFYGQQALGVLSWFQSGEFFARNRPRRMSDGLPVPMQVQLLEADMCPIFDSDAWTGMRPGNRIRQGIELDKVGRRVAFWFYREHPGDALGAPVRADDVVRVPAEEVIHVFRPLRPGQLRGVPESAPILAKLRTVMNFDDAVLTRQQLANLFTLFITRQPPASGEEDIDPITGKTVKHGADGAQIASLEPGLSQELLPGEDVKFSEPPDAGANYQDFMRQQNLGLASGQGVPYELMTGDIRDVSDRTLRVVINEFRRYCEQQQWTIFIPQFCERVRAWWARAGFLAGVLSQAELDEAMRTIWQPQGWAYVHPVQDVQAKKEEVAAGFRSRSSVVAERGDDPETVDQERAEERQREKDLGIAPPPPPSGSGGPGDGGQQQQGGAA